MAKTINAIASFDDLVLVTPNDNADLPGGTCRGFHVTVDGTLAVVTAAGQTRTYAAGMFPLNTPYPLALTRVKSTGTTATLFAGY